MLIFEEFTKLNVGTKKVKHSEELMKNQDPNLHNSGIAQSFSNIKDKKETTSVIRIEKVTDLHPAFPFFSLMPI